MAVESLKTLRRRVRSIRGIGKITRAMEMVAASKLRRAQGVLMAARPYAGKLQQLLAQLASGSELTANKLFQPQHGNHKVLVIFTADRGLNGSFNTNIIKAAEETLKRDPTAHWQLICVGKKGRDYFAKRKWPILESVTTLRGQADLPEARRIADLLVNGFLAGQFAEVWLLYSAFISTVVYRPTLVQYLPMSSENLGRAPVPDTGRQLNYIMEPSPARVLETLLPRYLASKLFITMAEVTTSEHSATMIAMNNATKNCKELADTLTLKLNKARQASITKELQEIVGGAEALKVA
jgi:F-type H+-transporting ATPase subunit gamma